MSHVRATVHDHRFVVDDTTDLPDGTEVRLLVIDTGDDLDDAERARLDAALEDAASSVERGEGIAADEAMRRLRDAAGSVKRTG
jgi:hypothetical protein